MFPAVCSKPVERCPQLVCDLSKAGVRRESVSWQCGRPPPRERPRSEASESLFATALPIAAMNMDQTGCPGIGRWIYVPFVPLFWTVSQIEVLGVLLTELSRSCSPFFGFPSRKFGSDLRDIVESQVTFLKRQAADMTCPTTLS